MFRQSGGRLGRGGLVRRVGRLRGLEGEELGLLGQNLLARLLAHLRRRLLDLRDGEEARLPLFLGGGLRGHRALRRGARGVGHRGGLRGLGLLHLLGLRLERVDQAAEARQDFLLRALEAELAGDLAELALLRHLGDRGLGLEPGDVDAVADLGVRDVQLRTLGTVHLVEAGLRGDGEVAGIDDSEELLSEDADLHGITFRFPGEEFPR